MGHHGDEPASARGPIEGRARGEYPGGSGAAPVGKVPAGGNLGRLQDRRPDVAALHQGRQVGQAEDHTAAQQNDPPPAGVHRPFVLPRKERLVLALFGNAVAQGAASRQEKNPRSGWQLTRNQAGQPRSEANDLSRQELLRYSPGHGEAFQFSQPAHSSKCPSRQRLSAWAVMGDNYQSLSQNAPPWFGIPALSLPKGSPRSGKIPLYPPFTKGD